MELRVEKHQVAYLSQFKAIGQIAPCIKKWYFYHLIKSIMKELIEKLNTEFEAFKAAAELQLEKSNKSAGTRARKSSLDLEKLLKEFRKVSLEESKK
jgi:hypothetical protein